MQHYSLTERQENELEEPSRSFAEDQISNNYCTLRLKCLQIKLVRLSVVVV